MLSVLGACTGSLGTLRIDNLHCAMGSVVFGWSCLAAALDGAALQLPVGGAGQLSGMLDDLCSKGTQQGGSLK
jgi:hypothetical protein